MIFKEGINQFIGNMDCNDKQRTEYEHTLRNYSRKGNEFLIYKEKNRLHVNQEEFAKWLNNWNFSKVLLNKNDYFQCLEFSLEAFYSNSPKSNFGQSTQRDAGKYITDHVSGKLGEIAFQKFLKNTYQIDVQLDFDVHGTVASQDITQVNKRKGPPVWNNPNIKVAIKTSKIKNFLLIVSDNEVELEDRTSDCYVLVRVGLFPNHIFRLLREHKTFIKLKKVIPDFREIEANITGFCFKNNLGKPVSKIEDLDFHPGKRYVKRSGELSKDWNSLIQQL